MFSVHTRHPSLPPIATLVPAPLAVAHQPAARLPAAHLALSIAAKQARPFAYYVRGRIPVNAAPVQVLALFNALSDVIRRYPDALHFDETVTRTALAATRILALIINPGPELIEASKQWRLPLDLSKPSVSPPFRRFNQTTHAPFSRCFSLSMASHSQLP